MFVPGPARLGLARIPSLPVEVSTDANSSMTVREGMFLASRQASTQSSGEDDLRRALTMRAYHLRARHRPIPQGVFAAVTTLDWTTGVVQLRLDAARPVSYPNPAWLHTVGDQALDDPDVLRGLTFTANTLAAQRGNRIEAEVPGGGATDPVRASVRATAATDLILRTCGSGATWQTIMAAVGDAWPGVTKQVIDQTLRTLIRQGLLLTDLVPENVRTEPLGHVLRLLPATHQLHSPLSRLHQLLIDADDLTPGAPQRFDALTAARRVCDAITEVQRPICVDTIADARIRLPETLVSQAAEAATLLWRTGTSGDIMDNWHTRFLDRYGANRFVALAEATDDIIGLGTDTGVRKAKPHSRRDTVIIGLYAHIVAVGGTEVVLDETTIAALSDRTDDEQPPNSAEIYARVLADGVTAGEENRYFLAITRTGQPAGSTCGRFTPYLATAPIRGSESGPMVAELAFWPRTYVAASLTSDTGLAPYRIRLNAQARGGDLMPNELAVVSDGKQLKLWSVRHDRQVIPVHHNSIGHHLMPPLAGWLCLLGQHPAAPLTGWSWAPVEGAPFLPRVRYGTTILTPARWQLPASLIDATNSPTDWAKALTEWRDLTTPPPPPVVVTDDDDQQLPLHLDRDDDSGLLRRYVRRGLTSVTEQHGGPGATAAVVAAATGHHALEIVVPLTTTDVGAPNLRPHTPVRKPLTGLYLPGSGWLSLAIRAPKPTQDRVLANLHDLAALHHNLWDRWFWLRYRTDALGPHLRIRFHGEPEILGGQLLPEVSKACTRLVHNRLTAGFTIEPYDQEIERYGGQDAIEIVEEVFYRDSELTAALLATESDPDNRIALTAISAAAIARRLTVGDRTALKPHRLDRSDRHTSARIRAIVRRLDKTTPPETGLWAARDAALSAYRKVVPLDRHIDCASSVIHMHANRLLGDNRLERIARALASDLLARESL